MTIRSSRGGFTLVELIVVAVLGLLVVMAAQTVMVNSVRAYTVVGARVQTQQSVRAGADVLFGELREISPSGGDLIGMGEDSLVIRSMRTFGVACEVDPSGTPELSVRRIGGWLEPGDSIFMLADNDPDIPTDDVWLSAVVGTVDTTTACPSGDAAQRITLPGMAAAMAADSVRRGAPVRSFTRYWFGIHEFDGEWYLGRRGVGGVVEPMVGPLEPRASRGLRFAYFDVMGAVTAVPSQVAQIKVTLRSSSLVTTQTGTPVGDSLVTSVFPRN